MHAETFPPFLGPLLLDVGPESRKFLVELADFGQQHKIASLGAGNRVTAVLLDFRAYDTLGEATVLFTAVTGVAVVLRARGKKA